MPVVFCTAMVNQAGVAMVLVFRDRMPILVLESAAAAAFGEALAKSSEVALAMAAHLDMDPRPVTRGPAS